MDQDYYVVSLKHTKSGDPCVSLWATEDKGYCWEIHRAAVHGGARVHDSAFYYCDGLDTLAVPRWTVQALLQPAPKRVVSSGGMVLANTAAVRDELLAEGIKAAAAREAQQAPRRPNDFPGHAEKLQEIARAISTVPLERARLAALWRCREALLRVGHYGEYQEPGVLRMADRALAAAADAARGPAPGR